MRTMLNMLFILCLALMLGATAAADEFIQNGGFETGDFAPWGTAGYDLESSVSPNHPHTGTWAGLFITPPRESVSLVQSMATGPGTYDLVFWISHTGNSGPNSLLVGWDGMAVYSLNDVGNFDYMRVEIPNLPGIGSDYTLFRFSSDDGANSNAWWIDDVSVTNQVPEPSTLMLLGSGALGLAGAGRRKLSRRTTD